MHEGRRRLSVDAEDLLIVEGVPALLIDRLVQSTDVRVHMEMPETEREIRLRADYRWRGTSDAAGASLLGATEETALVEKAKARADFVVAAWTAA
jgi:uridine kinase